MCVLRSVDDTLYLLGYVSQSRSTMWVPTAEQIAIAENQEIGYAVLEDFLVQAAH